jgi:hypothetical protein
VIPFGQALDGAGRVTGGRRVRAGSQPHRDPMRPLATLNGPGLRSFVGHDREPEGLYRAAWDYRLHQPIEMTIIYIIVENDS